MWRALAFGSVLLLSADAPAQVTCHASEIRFVSQWRTPQTFDFVDGATIRSVIAEQPHMHTLGYYASSPMLEAEVEVDWVREGARCGVCLRAVHVVVSEGLGTIGVHAGLEGSACHVDHVIAHELMHVEESARSVRRIRAAVEASFAPWRRTHGLTPMRCTETAMQGYVDAVGARVREVFRKEMAALGERQDAIDSPGARRRESQAMRDACGALPRGVR